MSPHSGQQLIRLSPHSGRPAAQRGQQRARWPTLGPQLAHNWPTIGLQSSRCKKMRRATASYTCFSGQTLKTNSEFTAAFQNWRASDQAVQRPPAVLRRRAGCGRSSVSFPIALLHARGPRHAVTTRSPRGRHAHRKEKRTARERPWARSRSSQRRSIPASNPMIQWSPSCR